MKNESGGLIDAYSFIEVISFHVDEILGKYYKVGKPTEDSSKTSFITERAIAIDDYCIINEDYPKAVTYTGALPVIGDNFGTKDDSYAGEKDKIGYTVVGTDEENSMCFVRMGTMGQVYEATTDEAGGSITVRRVELDGTLTGDVLTFSVLAD